VTEKGAALPQHRRIIPLALLAAAVSLPVAGCGAGSSTTSPATNSRNTLAYSDCMRAHGVPTFPDPGPNGGIDKNKIIAVGNSPQEQAAEQTCLRYMPADGLGPEPTSQQTRARLTGTLAFANCLRDHGFPRFPDPTSQGRLTPQMLTAAGIDLHQPSLLRAGLACAPMSHGAITRIDVERAVNGS
jgi:hypothetical protein